ncbi:MAG: CDP-archaeol synthase [Woeseiaceae bacterium]|nr:CDP-archaeol synthase [Woeseiaceae bacterium]
MSGSFALAVYILVAMGVAGAVHVLWLNWARSDLLLAPVDFGARFRGRRVFGDNKRLRGFIALPLAAACAFAVIAEYRHFFPAPLANGLWPLSTLQYAGIGFAAGFAFVLAELPNSFLKRQLGVAPGKVPEQGWQRVLCLLLDRVDSTLGVLIVLSLLAPVPAMTWLWVMLIGPGMHAFFSAMLHRIGVKERSL